MELRCEQASADMSYPSNTMNESVTKKKIMLPSIAIILLVFLVVGVFYALTFAKDILENVVGEVGGPQEGVVKFELQKARDLGVVEPQ